MHRLALSVLGVAATTLFVAAPITLDRTSPPSVGVSTASAATTVDINLFFTSLSPYGSWIPSADYNYVWVPTQVDANWSPYTNGHWVYTDRYGWYFVSDEPFASIVYHYGRWGYDPVVGWYWVPGTQFAGAWVAWRKGDTTLGWAPLPPQGKGYATSVSVSINIGSIPQHYWRFVPANDFLAPRLIVVVVAGDRQPTYFQQTQPAGVVVVQNNIVVNNVINVNFIQQQTKQMVTVAKVEAVNDPKQADSSAAATSTSLKAFVADVGKPTAAEKPATVVAKTEVQAPTKGQATNPAPTEALNVPAAGQGPTANPKCSDAAFAKANAKDCATTGNAPANAAATGNANATGAATATTGATPPTGQTPNAGANTAATGNATVNANPKCSDAAFAKANPKDCASANAAANATTGTTGNAAGANTAATGNAAATGKAATPDATGKTAVQGNVNANANPRCADAAYAKANPKNCATATPNAAAGAAGAASGAAPKAPGGAANTAPTTPPVNADTNAAANASPKANANTAVDGNASATAATGNARCSDAAFAKANAKLCGTQGGNAGSNANAGGNAAATAGASANGPANAKGSVSVQGNAAANARCNDATFAKNNPTVCKVQGKAGGGATAGAAASTPAPAAGGY